MKLQRCHPILAVRAIGCALAASLALVGADARVTKIVIESTLDPDATLAATGPAGAIKRISGRRVHEASGRVYHVEYHPPKVEGKDDETGDALIQRDDDKEETVRKRLEVYQAQTRPLVDYYGNWAKSGDALAPKYRKISGVGSLEDIRARILDVLK